MGNVLARVNVGKETLLLARPELARSLASLPFEMTTEMSRIHVTALGGNLFLCHVTLAQKLPGSFHPQTLHIVAGIRAQAETEEGGKMGDTQGMIAGNAFNRAWDADVAVSETLANLPSPFGQRDGRAPLVVSSALLSCYRPYFPRFLQSNPRFILLLIIAIPANLVECLN